MPELARDAALVLLTIAYLGGAVLMLVALAKVHLAWSTSGRPDEDTDPGENDGLALTRFHIGATQTLVVATAALTARSPAAVHSLAAHAHVIRRERARGSRPLMCPLILGGHFDQVEPGQAAASEGA